MFQRWQAGTRSVIVWRSTGTTAAPAVPATVKRARWYLYNNHRLFYWQANGTTDTVTPPLTPAALAELYGGNIFAGRREKKKEPPPLDIMVHLIARDEGGKKELIAALPKRARADLSPELALVSDLVTRIEAASAVVKARVRKMYEERELWLEEEEDEELLLLTFQ